MPEGRVKFCVFGGSRVMLLGIGLLILVFDIGCLKADPRKLTVFEYSGKHVSTGSQYDTRYVISFYPDGLIRNFSASQTVQGSQPEHVILAFEVKRESDLVALSYSANALKSWTTGFRINSRAASVKRSPEGEDLEFRRQDGLPQGTVVYDRVYGGKTYVHYRFTDRENEIEVLSGDSCTFGVNQTTRLPLLAAKNADGSAFTVGRVASGQTQIDWQNRPGLGMVLWRYVIDGDPLHADDPLIAIMNKEMVFGQGPQFSTILYPYIGGSPDE